MTFLPIVERELRIASRRRATYRLRTGLAAAGLATWFLLLMAGRSSPAEKGQILFAAVGVIALGFCLLAGVFLTADCLSEEKREGTLGLLFLTDLTGFDVVLGKLMATSLHAVYGLWSILPLLALPLLMGGVTVGEFWRVTLALLATLFLSLGVGMAVSAVSKGTREAMAGTLLILVGLAGFSPLMWWVQRLVLRLPGWDLLLWLSPPYLFARAFEVWARGSVGARQFWAALTAVLVMGLGALVLASVRLPRTWQEKGARPEGGSAKGRGGVWRFGSEVHRERRRPWLEVNPFYWLASRDRLPGRLAWCVIGGLFLVWLGFLGGCFSRRAGTRDLSFGVVMFLAYGIHQVLKWLVAIEASRRLSEDRHSGALELLLVTPLRVEEVLSGQLRALRQAFAGPITLTLLTNVGLLWLLVGPDPLSVRSERPPFCEMYLGGVLMLVVDFHALGWVGMWMALRQRRHHRAILATLGRVVLWPWLLLLFFVFLGIGGRGLRREDVMMLTAFWFGLSALIAFVLAGRAKVGLLTRLRQTVSATGAVTRDAAAATVADGERNR